MCQWYQQSATDSTGSSVELLSKSRCSRLALYPPKSAKGCRKGNYLHQRQRQYGKCSARPVKSPLYNHALTCPLIYWPDGLTPATALVLSSSLLLKLHFSKQTQTHLQPSNSAASRFPSFDSRTCSSLHQRWSFTSWAHTPSTAN